MNIDHCEETVGLLESVQVPKVFRKGKERKRKPDVFLTAGRFSHLDFIGIKLLNGVSIPEGLLNCHISDTHIILISAVYAVRRHH